MTGQQDPPSDYSFGGWEGHADEERLAGLQATPAQRLQWLEQALAWVHGVEERRRRGGASTTAQQR